MSVFVYKPPPGSYVLGMQPILANEVPHAEPDGHPLPSLTFMSQNLRGLGQASNCKALKLPSLKRHIGELDPVPHFVFVQELKGSTDPKKLLENGLDGCKAFVGGIGALNKPNVTSPMAEYDTAILVYSHGEKRLEDAWLVEATSSSCQTLVAFPQLGLLLVNIHGPPTDSQERLDFFEVLHSLLSCYKRHGWIIVVGGDFNIAPRICDRAKDTETQRSRTCVLHLCLGLGLVDVAANTKHTDIKANSHLTFSIELARNSKVAKNVETMDHPVSVNGSSSMLVDQAISHGYISRIDLFLIPGEMAKMTEHIIYSHRRKTPANSLYDHDEVCLTILDQAGLDLRRASPVKTLPISKQICSGACFAFSTVDEVAATDDINTACLLAKILELEEYDELPEPQPLPFEVYNELTAEFRGIQAKYFRHASPHCDSDSGPVITDLPDSDLGTPLEPNVAAIDKLLALHLEHLGSSGQLPTSNMVEQTTEPITLDEIHAACHRIIHHTSPGPNGVSLELFKLSKTACTVLCKLANYVLEHPDLVSKEFVASHIIADCINGILVSSRRIAQHNIEYRIIADVLAMRLSHALSRSISPEQSAVLPGRCVGDTINMLLMAQHHLVEAGGTALFLFLDEAQVDCRFSFTLVLRVLHTFGLPPDFIAAIGALFRFAPTSFLPSNVTSEPYDEQNCVYKGDRLASILFVIVLELLWHSLCKHLPKEAFVKLPTGKMSHLSHGNSVVITTSSSDYLPDIHAALDLFSTATGVSFDLCKTNALFIGQDPSAAPYVPCVKFPVKALADGEVFKYLGAYFGNIMGKSSRGSGRGSKGNGMLYDPIISAELTELLTSADDVTKDISDHPSRIKALDALITPRLRHLIAFMPFTPSKAPTMTMRLKELVRSYAYQLPVADDEVALEACTGIYGFVDFDSTYYAVQLEQIHIVATYFQRLAYPGHNGPAVLAVPTWAKLMLHCWRTNIQATPNPNYPEMLRNLDAADFAMLFFDPLLQFAPRRHGRVPICTWACVWTTRFAALFSNLAHKGYEVRIVWLADNARALHMPLFGSFLWSPANIDWNVIVAAFKTMTLRPNTPFTVAELPQLIAIMRSFVYKPVNAKPTEARNSIVLRLKKLGEQGANDSGEDFLESDLEREVFQSAFDGGELPIIPIPIADFPAITTKLRRLKYAKVPSATSEARDKMVLSFDKIYNDAYAHDMMFLNSSFDSALASHLLAYGYPDYPELYIPFTEWHNVPAMRAKLNLLPEIPKTDNAPETPETATVAKVRRTRNTRKALSTPETPAPSNKRKSVD